MMTTVYKTTDYKATFSDWKELKIMYRIYYKVAYKTTDYNTTDYRATFSNYKEIK